MSICACRQAICSFPGRRAKFRFHIGDVLISERSVGIIVGYNKIMVWRWPVVRELKLDAYLARYKELEMWEPKTSLAGLCRLVKSACRLKDRWFFRSGAQQFLRKALQRGLPELSLYRSSLTFPKAKCSPGLIYNASRSQA